MEESRLYLADAFEIVPIAMMIIDQDGRILKLNKRQEEQSQVSGEKVIGTFFHESWSNLMKQQDFDEYYWNLIKNSIPYTFVFHDIKPQFYDLAVAGIAYGIPIPSSSGFLLVHDVTRHTKTNQRATDQLNVQLSQTSTFLRSLLDSTPQAVFTMNRQGTILTANHTAEVLFNRTKGSFLWQNLSSFLSSALDTSEIERLASSNFGLTTQGLKKDHPPFPVKIKLNPVQSSDSTKSIYLAIIEDQTYERAIEAELSQRLKFEMILSDLFATFINVNPEDLNDRIDIALSRIGQQLDVDRCYLTKYEADKKTNSIAHSWSRNGTDPAPIGFFPEQLPWLRHLVNERQPLQISDLGNASLMKADLRPGPDYKTRSLLYTPLIREQVPFGSLIMEQVRHERAWDHELVLRIKIISEVLLSVLQKKKSEEALQRAFREIEQLKDRMETERNYLLDEIKLEHNFDEIIGQSPPCKKYCRRLKKSPQPIPPS